MRAYFTNTETGRRVLVSRKDIVRVDAAPFMVEHRAVIVLGDGRLIPVQETPVEVRRRLRIEPETRKIVSP